MSNAKLIAKIGAGTTALVVPLVIYSEGTIFHSYKDPIGIITACNATPAQSCAWGRLLRQRNVGRCWRRIYSSTRMI
jgi:fructose-specific phosphotransferase system IIC component